MNFGGIAAFTAGEDRPSNAVAPADTATVVFRCAALTGRRVSLLSAARGTGVLHAPLPARFRVLRTCSLGPSTLAVDVEQVTAADAEAAEARAHVEGEEACRRGDVADAEAAARTAAWAAAAFIES